MPRPSTKPVCPACRQRVPSPEEVTRNRKRVREAVRRARAKKAEAAALAGKETK